MNIQAYSPENPEYLTTIKEYRQYLAGEGTAHVFFHHLGFLVNNIEETISNYHQLYPNKVILLNDPPSVMFDSLETCSKIIYKGKSTKNGGCYQSVLSANGINLELFQLIPGRRDIYTEFYHACGYGLHHISFETNDLSYTYQRLTRQGFHEQQYFDFGEGLCYYMSPPNGLYPLMEILHFHS